MTKGELALLAVPDGMNFDHALPQGWVDAMYQRGFDVVPHFVWAYEEGSIFGFPYPITNEGRLMLCKVAAGIA